MVENSSVVSEAAVGSRAARTTGKWTDLAFYALLVAVAGYCVWLSGQNRDLRMQVDKADDRVRYATVGDWLPAMALPSVQDPRRSIALGAPQRELQFVYFYSPSCKYCEASTPHVRRLYEQLKGRDDVEMVAASVAGRAETERHYVESRSTIPTVVLPGVRERWVYKLAMVPALIGIDRHGRVRYAHYGLISDKDVPHHPQALASAHGSKLEPRH